jgi:glycosyltransferase involved in cell wall biosynthesis
MQAEKLLESEKRTRVLVLPDLFPEENDFVKGTFILDYISSTKSFCDNVVFYNRLSGTKKGLYQDYNYDFPVFRCNTFSFSIPSWLKPIAYLIWFYKGYRQILKICCDPDILHVHGVILNGTLGYLISRRLKIPLIITVHQGPFSIISDKYFVRLWAKKILEKADVVLTVSNHLRQEITESKIYPKDVRVTYNPVNTDLFRIQNPDAHLRNMIFAGRLDNFKGALRTVIAFSMISAQIPEWTLTIIGEGEDTGQINKFVSENSGLEKRVILLGQLQKKAISNELNKAAFLVFPSLHESFGLVIAEAMACGLPVIVGNKTAPPEFVDDECGIKIEAGDINALSGAILNMTQIFSKFDRQIIRNKVVERFGFDNFGSRLNSVYSELIKESRCVE